MRVLTGDCYRNRLINLNFARRTVLVLLPALTLVIGLSLTELSTGQDRPIHSNELVALVVAAVAPLITVLVLSCTEARLRLDPRHHGRDAHGNWHDDPLFALADGGSERAVLPAIVVRHAFFIGAGFLALAVGALLSRHLDRIRGFPYTILGIALVLTLATIVLGETVNGARLWLQIGPIQFQPSEIARLLLAGFVAVYLYDRRHLVVAPWRLGSLDLPPAPYLLPLVGAVLTAVAVFVFRTISVWRRSLYSAHTRLIASVLNSKSSLGSAGAILVLAAVGSFAASPRVRDRVPRGSIPGPIRADVVFSLFRPSYGLSAGGMVGQGAADFRGSCTRGAYRLHSGGGREPVGLGRGVGGACAGGHHICRCVAAALSSADGFCSVAGARHCRLARYSGAFDLRWNLASFTVDRAYAAAGFVRGNVNCRHSVCTRNRVGDRSGPPGNSPSAQTEWLSSEMECPQHLDLSPFRSRCHSHQQISTLADTGYGNRGVSELMPEGPANGAVDRGGPARPPCTPVPKQRAAGRCAGCIVYRPRRGIAHRTPGTRRLPGASALGPDLGESLDAVATRILDDQFGSSERYQEQLYSISHGSEGNGTVSVTYLALALADAADATPDSAAWFNANAPGELNSVDQMIVDYALLRLRAKLGYTAIAFHLLPPSFTLSELQAVYEVVLDREVDKRNFRRRIHAAGLLEATGESRREGSHRPARLYRLRTAHDTETYLTPAWTTQPVRKVATR